MRKQISPKIISLTFGILVILFAVGFYIFAWTEPADSPPVCPPGQPGCDAPLNVGPTDQEKTGNLTLPGTLVGKNFLILRGKSNNSGPIYLEGNQVVINNDLGTGNIGIGKSNPVVKLDVNGTANIKSTLNLVGPGAGAEGGQINLADPAQTSGGENNAWAIDNNSGNLRVFYNAGVARFFISNAGNIGIGTTNPGAFKLNVIGDANISGKLTLTTLDPQYEIEGKKYATYGSAIAGGVKEETLGLLNLEKCSDVAAAYCQVIEFDKLEEGSDLWLFENVTDFGANMEYLVINLTPEGNKNVWYKKLPAENKLVIYGTETGEVSYRFIANRNDWQEWPNKVE